MTGTELYETALDLCGLRKTDGSLPGDVADLTQRLPAFINLLLAENSILNAKIEKTEHSVLAVASAEEALPVCDIIAKSVLPYGLARLLMLGEDDSLAASFGRLYEEAGLRALTFGKATAFPISEVY